MDNQQLDYPLRLKPIFRSYLWGGDLLQKELGKCPPGEGPWAESWEVVDHGQDQSIVENGPYAGQSIRQLMAMNSGAILGPHAASHDALPLLFKYLDCNRVLSVQVHPDDEYAKRMEVPDLGKTEAWFILAAQPNAKIYAGLKSGVTRASLATAIQQGRTEEMLHEIDAKPGDCVFIPAGTVHALGDGLLVAEIQQASDTTFRLFDWDRVDADGNSRPLHIDQALEVIDYQAGAVSIQSRLELGQPSASVKTLVECDKFVLQGMTGEQIYRCSTQGFRIVSVVAGSLKLNAPHSQCEAERTQRIHRGHTVLIPDACQDVELCLESDGESPPAILIASLPH